MAAPNWKVIDEFGSVVVILLFLGTMILGMRLSPQLTCPLGCSPENLAALDKIWLHRQI